MADIAMHREMARDLIKTLDPDIVQAFDENYFTLGSQGPDPYFYRIFKKRKTAMDIGDRLHGESINLCFKTLIETIKADPSAIKLGFLFGYIAHFSLDTTIHPYVYHRVGIYQPDEPAKKKLRGLHLRFERHIDAHFLKQRYQQKPHTLALHKTALINHELSEEIITLLDETLKDVYDIEHAGTIYEKGLISMRRVLKYGVYDRFGLKKQLYRFVDLFNKKRDLCFKDLSFYGFDQQYDYLNQKETCWHHPITNETICDSVSTLYQKAIERAKALIEAVYNHIFHQQPLTYTQTFKNRSLNTGLDCDDQRPMQYFNIYTQKRL